MKSLTVSEYIAVPPSTVYDFASNPANLPAWVPSFCKSAALIEGRWMIQSTAGLVEFEFVPRNNLGVLDHTVTISPDLKVVNPMRVIANGTGSEILFTLIQHEGVSDRKFQEDLRMVADDLRCLKRLLEASGKQTAVLLAR